MSLPDQPKKPDRAGKRVSDDFSAAWHSRLNPHIEAIWAWRNQGKSFREIAGLMLAEKGVTISHTTLHRFVRSRKRRLEQTALPALPGFEAPQKLKEPSPKPSPGPVAMPAVKAPQQPTQPARRGMLPPSDNKHRDKYGAPVEPPPNPNAFRSENL